MNPGICPFFPRWYKDPQEYVPTYRAEIIAFGFPGKSSLRQIRQYGWPPLLAVVAGTGAGLGAGALLQQVA